MIAGLPCTALRDAVLTHPTLVEGLIPLFSSAASAHNVVETRGAQISAHEVNCKSNEKNRNSRSRRCATCFATCAALLVPKVGMSEAIITSRTSQITENRK